MPFAVTMVSILWLYGISRHSIKFQSEVGVCLENKTMLLCYSWSYWWGMFTGADHYSLWTSSRFIDHKDQYDNLEDLVFDQNIMPRLYLLDKARVIGQIEAGIHQNVVAQNFCISQSTISRLRQKFRETGDVKDIPRSGDRGSLLQQKIATFVLGLLGIGEYHSKVIQVRISGQHGRMVSDQTIKRLHPSATHPTIGMQYEEMSVCCCRLPWIYTLLNM